MNDEKTLENILALNGERFVIDEEFGLWVKFDANRVSKAKRRHEIKYSLSLHNKYNERILGFDNLHEINYAAKRMVAPKRTYEHWHSDENDKGKPYDFQNADKLVQDFWEAVEEKMLKLKEIKNE
jgi:hypothetical protein